MLTRPPAQLEKALGIHFKHPDLLEQALTHKSYVVKDRTARHNERLEFLGDSILSAAVADILYLRHPASDEGKLSKLKSMLVSRPHLAEWSKSLGLGEYLRLSPGEESTGGRDRASLLSNALEAVIGAVFLEAGYEAARRFIEKYVSRRKHLVETDHKSRLQEIIQKKYKLPPTYESVQETGPDHDKTFEIVVKLKKRGLGTGTGKSKKEAEQAAAKDALKKIKEN